MIKLCFKITLIFSKIPVKKIKQNYDRSHIKLALKLINFKLIHLFLLFTFKLPIMLGTLTDLQMNHLLASQVRGRIACTNGKRSFILPFTYIFDGDYIYGELHDKRKMEVLRKNPVVCFEIDQIHGLTSWQEVIVEGKIEELSGEEEKKAKDFLSEHIYPFAFDKNSYKTKPAAGMFNKRGTKPILCRIKIEKKSGCFEREFV